MGRVLRAGIRAIARKELESLAVEKVLEDRPGVRRDIEESVDEIMEQCGNVESEHEAEECISRYLPREKTDFKEKIKRRM